VPTIRRRIVFWIWIAGFAALTAWWIFYLPYDREALFRAVPRNASIVATQTSLGERWRDILGSPPGKVAAQWFPEAAHPRTPAGAAELGRMLGFLAPRRTVVAYTPSLGPGGPPAWTATSWLGGRAQALRWRWLPEVRRRFQRFRTGAAAVWMSREPVAADRGWVSFVVTDGVFLACLSSDPLAVRHLVPLLDTPAPLSAGALDLARRSAEFGGGLLAWMRPPLPDAPARAAWIFELDALTPAGAEGRWTITPAVGPAPPPTGPAAPAPLRVPAIEEQALRLLGHPAAALLISRYDPLAGLMHRSGLDGLDAGLRTNVVELAANPPCFTALLGGEQSGRLLGLRVPTLLAGLRLEEPAAVVESAGAILDALNAGEARGLIPRREEAAGREMVVVDSTRPGLYRTMKPEERPAAAAWDGWLLVSSNADVLRRLLQRQPAPLPGAAPAIWRPANLADRPAAYLRSDVRSAAQALIDVAAVAKISLGIRDAPDTEARRARLDQTLTLLHALEPLGACTFWLTRTDGRAVIDFHLRPAPESP